MHGAPSAVQVQRLVLTVLHLGESSDQGVALLVLDAVLGTWAVSVDAGA